MSGKLCSPMWKLTQCQYTMVFLLVQSACEKLRFSSHFPPAPSRARRARKAAPGFPPDAAWCDFEAQPFRIAAWAADSRAMGTRKGEQET